MNVDEIYEPKEVPVGRLELADNRVYLWVSFCDTCRKRGTASCYMCGEYEAHTAKYAYVSGAFPWDCIFCRRGRNGKPLKSFEREHTYDDCPYSNCTLDDAAEAASNKKWGCKCLDLDGKRGTFCKAAVRCIHLAHRGVSRFPSACGHYEWLENADHAHPLWDNLDMPSHPMSFKCVRDYAAERKCETLYDLLMAFDSLEFCDFCKAREDRMPKRALDVIDMYAQVYGWFRIGDDNQYGYRKGVPAEQNIRVAKTVSAVANARAREESAKKAAKKSKPKEGDDAQ